MYKIDELEIETSCLSKAAPGEMIFVLRAHDVAAPNTIRAWVDERIKLGKNTMKDETIHDALKCAAKMEEQQREGY